jgi:hypothetical protein
MLKLGVHMPLFRGFLSERIEAESQVRFSFACNIRRAAPGATRESHSKKGGLSMVRLHKALTKKSRASTCSPFFDLRANHD